MSEETTKPAPKLWLPQHWPSWGAVWFMRAVAPLPIPFLLGLGTWLGRFVFYVVPVRRAVTLRNLELCFPELDRRARWQLARRSYESMGMGVFEALLTYNSDAKRLAGWYTIEGLEHFEKARATGRGTILLSAHFHTLELSSRIGLLHFDFVTFMRDPNNPVFAKIIREGRSKLSKKLLGIDELKGGIRALREGDVLWYAPDQGKRFKDTAIVPFFGVPAVTNAATGKIAKLGRALIVPWAAVRERRDGRWHYRVRIGAPLAELPEDPVEEAKTINALVESFVRFAPEQYLWQHKRFKGRGEGFPDVYAGMR